MNDETEKKPGKMSLARALKEKERIARRLRAARELFHACNCTSPDTKPTASVSEVFEKMNRLNERYLKIRKAISAGNSGISDQLTEMLVVRGEIGFYENLDCREEEFKEIRGRHTDETYRSVRVVYNTFIKDSERRDILERLQARLDDLQDSVDSYNATHSVTIPD